MLHICKQIEVATNTNPYQGLKQIPPLRRINGRLYVQVATNTNPYQGLKRSR